MDKYTADPKYAKKLRRSKQKTYKIYRIARSVFICSLCVILLFDLYVISKTPGISQLAETLLLCLGLDILILIIPSTACAVMSSVAREFSMNKAAETCTFNEDHILLESIPFKNRRGKYDRIQHKFYYRDIRSIDCEADYRITLHGSHTITRFYTKGKKQFGDQTDTTLPLSIINYYPEFEEIKQRLLTVCQVNEADMADMFGRDQK